MKNLRDRVQGGETLFGCFLNLGSSLTTEIVGSAGFDWVLIDLEHGAGFESNVLSQLQAAEHTPAASVIRVESSERQRVHRVLDLGAHGIMFPRINTPDQARAAVSTMRYLPEGVRGIAKMNRACGFGSNFESYVASADRSLLGVVQVETEESLNHLDSIAEIDGVDVLFVGPLDLTQSLGVPGQFNHPRFLEALSATSLAARRFHKTAGIILNRPEELRSYMELGYRFIACNSDGGLLNGAARALANSLKSAGIS